MLLKNSFNWEDEKELIRISIWLHIELPYEFWLFCILWNSTENETNNDQKQQKKHKN